MAITTRVSRAADQARGTQFYEERLRPLLPQQVGLIHQWPLTLMMVSVVYFAFAGGYWDIGWHIAKGRDTLLAPPHVFILTGLGLVAVILSLFTAMSSAATVEGRPVSTPMRMWRGLPYSPILVIALAMMATPQAAFGLDELWHRTFGLDVTLWSPPHLLIIISAAAALFAITAIIAGEANIHDRSRRLSVLRPLRSISRGELLACVAMGSMTLVSMGTLAEFDFDIPQWDLRLGAPLMAILAAFPAFLALTLIGRRWSTTIVMGLVTITRLAFVGINDLVNVPHADFVVLVIPALILDGFFIATGGRLRGRPLAIALGAFPVLVVGSEAVQQSFRSQPVWTDTLSTPGVWIAVVALGALAGYVGVRTGRMLRPSDDLVEPVADGVAERPAAVAGVGR